MKFETKFNIGEAVFYIEKSDNINYLVKIRKGKIKSIITCMPTIDYEIAYENSNYFFEVTENELFRTLDAAFFQDLKKKIKEVTEIEVEYERETN